MPLYSYYCEGCDETYELLQPASSAKQVNCEACGSTLDRLVGRPTLNTKHWSERPVDDDHPPSLEELGAKTHEVKSMMEKEM